jgi:hypothetical protein
MPRLLYGIFLALAFSFSLAQEPTDPLETPETVEMPENLTPVIQLSLKKIYCHNPKALLKGDQLYFGFLSQYVLTQEERSYEVGSSPLHGKFSKKVEKEVDILMARYPEEDRRLMSWTKIYMIRHDSDTSTLHNRMIFSPFALAKREEDPVDPKKIDKKSLISLAEKVKIQDGLQTLENPKEDLNVEIVSFHYGIDEAEKLMTNKDLWLSEIDLTLFYLDHWQIRTKVGYKEDSKVLQSGKNSLKLNLEGSGFSYDIEFEIMVP